MPNEPVLTEEEAFQLVAYLVSSAELSVLEPDLYGSFRLVDAAARVLSPLAERADPARRSFYEELEREIERKKVRMMWDREGYLEFLARLPRHVAAELRRRHGTTTSPESEA